MKNSNTPKNDKKSIRELKIERDKLESQIEEYLLVLGADTMLVKDIIIDLKSQMCTYADENVNNMIADLICIENKIKLAEKTEEDEISEMINQLLSSGK